MFARHPVTLGDDSKDAEHRAEESRNEITRLEAQLEGEDAGKIISRHHELLHRYNETKDATQFLIGKIATFKETTIKQLHADYNLPTGD